MPSTATSTRTHSNNDDDSEKIEIEKAEDREVRDARSEAEQRTRDRQNSRRYMEYADREGRHVTRALVRSTNDAFSGLIPRAWVRPGAVLRAWFDMYSLGLDLQRAAWDEMTQVWREDTQRAARSARSDERVDWDRDWEEEKDRIGR